MLTFYCALLILHYNAREQQYLYQTWPKCYRLQSGRLGFGILDFRAEENQDRGAFCSMTPYHIPLWKHHFWIRRLTISYPILYIFRLWIHYSQPSGHCHSYWFLIHIPISQNMGVFPVSPFTKWPWEQDMSSAWASVCLPIKQRPLPLS